MGIRDARHFGALIFHWGPVVLVLALLTAAGATYRFDLGERVLGIEPANPVDNPAKVAPPEGLDLPEPVPAPAVATPLPASGLSTSGRALAPAAVRRAIEPLLKNPDLGKHVVALVQPLGTRTTVFRTGHGLATPASTLKLLTTTAALEALGPATTFTTTVVEGATPRSIVLVGGGDPFLEPAPVKPAEAAETYPTRADIVTLAKHTAAALKAKGRTRVRLGYDDTLFSGPAVDPHWEKTYIPEEVVSPIGALWVDRGVDASGEHRVADPAKAAAEAFARALERVGITVLADPTRTRAPRDTAGQLAAVESAPLSEIVQEVLTTSDNEAAEVLARHVGLAVSGTGSFAAGVAGIKQTLAGLGVPLAGARLYDGSGLARDDRLDPATLLGVLRVASARMHPELRAVIDGLPVAAFSGSLTDRFVDGDPAGRGRVRAKTGTLTGVHALAGVVQDLDGELMLVALVADQVPTANPAAADDARAALDRAAAALAGCHCAAAPATNAD